MTSPSGSAQAGSAQAGSAQQRPGGSVPAGLTPLVSSQPGSFRQGTESGRQRTRGPRRRFVDATGAGGAWRDEDPSARHRPPQLVPALTSLSDLAGDLLERARDDETRRAAQAVVSLPDVRATVIALAAEAQLPENEPRNGAVLQVLSGRVTLRTGGADLAVAAGELVSVPAQRHAVRADEDAALLLTVPLT